MELGRGGPWGSTTARSRSSERRRWTARPVSAAPPSCNSPPWTAVPTSHAVRPAAAPAARGVRSGVPVVARGAEDVFGSALPDRRRQDRAGTAYPLFDGHFVIGALVMMGPQLPPGTPVADQLQRLVAELGSRLPAARAVFEAEQRAVSDPLTGLRNRRELERALTQHGSKTPQIATLIYADLDHFKNLNDTLGHA